MKNQETVEEQENPIIKISYCSKCGSNVRVAVEHCMTTKSKNEFLKEVMKYNLSVKEMLLSDYQKLEPDFCKCK